MNINKQFTILNIDGTLQQQIQIIFHSNITILDSSITTTVHSKLQQYYV
jgi:hypothetical protein